MWTLIPEVPIGCRSPRKRGPYSMPSHTPPLRVSGTRGWSGPITRNRDAHIGSGNPSFERPEASLRSSRRAGTKRNLGARRFPAGIGHWLSRAAPHDRAAPSPGIDPERPFAVGLGTAGVHQIADVGGTRHCANGVVWNAEPGQSAGGEFADVPCCSLRCLSRDANSWIG